MFPQHAAQAAAEHNPEDEVVEEVERGGELGHLVVHARKDPSTSQSSGRGYSQVVSVSEFQKKNMSIPMYLFLNLNISWLKLLILKD